MRARAGLIAVGVLVALLAAAPIGMGFVVERAYLDQIAEADRAAEGIRVRGAIERGLWISPAETLIEVEEAEGVSTISLHHELVHGPIPLGELLRGRSPFTIAMAVVDTGYDADPAELPRIAAALEGRPLLRLIAWLRFDRSVRLLLTAPELELDEDGLRSDGLRAEAVLDVQEADAEGWLRVDAISLRDGEGELTLAPSEARFAMRPEGEAARAEGDVALGAIAARGASGSLHVAPSSGRYETTMRDDVVGEGGGILEVGEITVEPESGTGEPVRRLRGLRLEESWRLDPVTGLRAFQTTIDFEAAGSDAQGYGPGRAVLAVRNIDPEVAAAFREALDGLEGQALAEPERTRVRQSLLAEWMPRLFGSSPEIVLESLSVTGPQGGLTGRGRLGVDGSDPAFLSDPLMVWMQTTGELALDVGAPVVHAIVDSYLIDSVRDEMVGVSPADVAEMAAFMRDGVMSQLVAQGVLVTDGERYTIDARLEDGLPTVNGQPIDPGLLEGVLGGP